jgi:hypothetical protein
LPPGAIMASEEGAPPADTPHERGTAWRAAVDSRLAAERARLTDVGDIGAPPPTTSSQVRRSATATPHASARPAPLCVPLVPARAIPQVAAQAAKERAVLAQAVSPARSRSGGRGRGGGTSPAPQRQRLRAGAAAASERLHGDASQQQARRGERALMASCEHERRSATVFLAPGTDAYLPPSPPGSPVRGADGGGGRRGEPAHARMQRQAQHAAWKKMQAEAADHERWAARRAAFTPNRDPRPPPLRPPVAPELKVEETAQLPRTPRQQRQHATQLAQAPFARREALRRGDDPEPPFSHRPATPRSGAKLRRWRDGEAGGTTTRGGGGGGGPTSAAACAAGTADGEVEAVLEKVCGALRRSMGTSLDMFRAAGIDVSGSVGAHELRVLLQVREWEEGARMGRRGGLLCCTHVHCPARRLRTAHPSAC